MSRRPFLAERSRELTMARTALQRAESLVGSRRFLVGDTLSLADLYLAPQIANCREKAPQLLEGLDALATWAHAMGQRESFRRTAQHPAALKTSS